MIFFVGFTRATTTSSPSLLSWCVHPNLSSFFCGREYRHRLGLDGLLNAFDCIVEKG